MSKKRGPLPKGATRLDTAPEDSNVGATPLPLPVFNRVPSNFKMMVDDDTLEPDPQETTSQSSSSSSSSIVTASGFKYSLSKVMMFCKMTTITDTAYSSFVQLSTQKSSPYPTLTTRFMVKPGDLRDLQSVAFKNLSRVESYPDTLSKYKVHAPNGFTMIVNTATQTEFPDHARICDILYPITGLDVPATRVFAVLKDLEYHPVMTCLNRWARVEKDYVGLKYMSKIVLFNPISNTDELSGFLNLSMNMHRYDGPFSLRNVLNSQKDFYDYCTGLYDMNTSLKIYQDALVVKAIDPYPNPSQMQDMSASYLNRFQSQFNDMFYDEMVGKEGSSEVPMNVMAAQLSILVTGGFPAPFMCPFFLSTRLLMRQVGCESEHLNHHMCSIFAFVCRARAQAPVAGAIVIRNITSILADQPGMVDAPNALKMLFIYACVVQSLLIVFTLYSAAGIEVPASLRLLAQEVTTCLDLDKGKKTYSLLSKYRDRSATGQQLSTIVMNCIVDATQAFNESSYRNCLSRIVQIIIKNDPSDAPKYYKDHRTHDDKAHAWQFFVNRVFDRALTSSLTSPSPSKPGLVESATSALSSVITGGVSSLSSLIASDPKRPYQPSGVASTTSSSSSRAEVLRGQVPTPQTLAQSQSHPVAPPPQPPAQPPKVMLRNSSTQSVISARSFASAASPPPAKPIPEPISVKSATGSTQSQHQTQPVPPSSMAPNTPIRPVSQSFNDAPTPDERQSPSRGSPARLLDPEDFYTQTGDQYVDGILHSIVQTFLQEGNYHASQARINKSRVASIVKQKTIELRQRISAVVNDATASKSQKHATDVESLKTRLKTLDQSYTSIEHEKLLLTNQVAMLTQEKEQLLYNLRAQEASARQAENLLEKKKAEVDEVKQQMADAVKHASKEGGPSYRELSSALTKKREELNKLAQERDDVVAKLRQMESDFKNVQKDASAMAHKLGVKHGKSEDKTSVKKEKDDDDDDDYDSDDLLKSAFGRDSYSSSLFTDPPSSPRDRKGGHGPFVMNFLQSLVIDPRND